VKVSILCDDLSSNFSIRAHRLALMAAQFAEVEIVGPVAPEGPWEALPDDLPLRTVPGGCFPD
jgi:hypothetical protein